MGNKTKILEWHTLFTNFDRHCTYLDVVHDVTARVRSYIVLFEHSLTLMTVAREEAGGEGAEVDRVVDHVWLILHHRRHRVPERADK